MVKPGAFEFLIIVVQIVSMGGMTRSRGWGVAVFLEMIIFLMVGTCRWRAIVFRRSRGSDRVVGIDRRIGGFLGFFRARRSLLSGTGRRGDQWASFGLVDCLMHGGVLLRWIFRHRMLSDAHRVLRHLLGWILWFLLWSVCHRGWRLSVTRRGVLSGIRALVEVPLLPVWSRLGFNADGVGEHGRSAGQTNYFQEAVCAGVVRREGEWCIVIVKLDFAVRMVRMRKVRHGA